MSIMFRAEIETSLTLNEVVGSIQDYSFRLDPTGLDSSDSSESRFHSNLRHGQVVEVSERRRSEGDDRVPRFGMYTSVGVYVLPDGESHERQVAEVIELVAEFVGGHESRGFAVYYEPVSFYWDGRTVTVNDRDGFVRDASVEAFEAKGLGVVVAELDIDVGWDVVD